MGIVLTARNLGVIVDNHLKLNKHVNNVCKWPSFAINNIRKIRQHLTQADCEGTTTHTNTAVRLVTKSKKSELLITPVLGGLH